MKKISTEITDKNGVEKIITVFVDDETAAVLEECDEDFRRFYILEEHKDYNRTRAETRRHISYEAMAYLMKYLEKTGEKIIYSKGLPQYFISDILDDDVVCTIGQEEKKLLLFDDFTCRDEAAMLER